jgi:hypothetical protein
MDFGSALSLLKNGKKISRAGWNGKGMYIFLDAQAVGPDGMLYQPMIVMFTAQKQYQPGWLASQADMLATDWDEIDAAN